MILNIRLHFEDENQNKYTYKYGTFYAVESKTNRSYESVPLRLEDIVLLKDELQKTLQNILDKKSHNVL